MPIRDGMHRLDKPRSGVALGGIGAGFTELRKDGVFYNWNIFNNRPLGSGEFFEMPEDSMLFFILRYEVEGEYPRMKLLQIHEGYRVAAIRNHYYAFPWLTGVQSTTYEAAFPFIRMTFGGEEMPLEVELEAFSPFIPHDVKNSALPTALFDFSVRSTCERPVDVMLMASMHNAVGYDVEEKYHVARAEERGGYKLVEVTEDMDESLASYGSQALASLAPDSTHYLGWEAVHPYYEIVIRNRELPNYDDTEGRNKVDPDTGRLKAMYGHYSSIAVSRKLVAEERFDHSFVMGWHFPNLYSRDGSRLEGHYYDNFFDGAGEVVDYVVENRKELRSRSRQFVEDSYDSSAPDFLLDQVNSQLNTFFTSSWLTRDMDFGISEGLSPDRAYGPLATTDVSMYGAMSVAALFPELHKNMMRAHRRLQAPDGEIAHGINRNFQQTDTQESVTGRLDLPSQYALLSLLGYFWTGDRDYLRRMWPSIKDALDYVLRERDRDGDCLPDMEGTMCTYDNFAMYGAASYVSSLWMGALKAAAQAAKELDDDAAAARYSGVLERAAEAFERKLWNGEYYILYNDEGGEHGGRDEGCLTDQLIGQWAIHLVGLGELFEPERVHSALETICRISRQPWGLVNCRWPDDRFLHPVDEDCWHDQANTCWSGVELAFASFLIYEGMLETGLGVIENVDERYRAEGMYWDHVEFGGHYYRPMSAWAITNALLGLSIRSGHYRFDPKLDMADVRLFFSFGDGTAHYERRVAEDGEVLEVRVRTGELTCRSVKFGLWNDGFGTADIYAGGRRMAGAESEADGSNGLRVSFPDPVRVPAGKTLRVVVAR